MQLPFETGTKKDKEIIGRVTLDLSVYSGEDLYCDGSVEDELLEIARDRSEAEYPGIIEESGSWPILYHLSPLRENIVEWLPIDKNMKVLEIGAGCGAITGVLSRKAGRVDCVDLSFKRSRINAYRHMDSENVTIHVGNFTDVEKGLARDYDYILLIGVFEYAQSYIDSADPYGDFLRTIGSHLKPDGSIAIAIENRFGLKYWAGCAEDHLGTYFSSLENYPDGGVVRTFTDKALIGIAEECGFGEHRMYYPYPDYKFMTNLYSDRRLPQKGELKLNIRNMDRDRYLLFNEKNVYDSILDEGLYHLYSNSYMLILGSCPDTDYVRYSNDRAPECAICTEITEKHGKKRVIKRALDPRARAHLERYAENCRMLTERYKDSRLRINRAVMTGDGNALEIEYVEGETLESRLDSLLFDNDTEGFVRLFDDYLDRISYGSDTAKITDIDLIFSNILINGDEWTVIDYEWTVKESWTAGQLGFRAVYCYILEDEKRQKLDLDLILGKLNISDKQAEEYREDEMRFQKNVTGNHRSLDEIRERIGNRVIVPGDQSCSDSGSLSLRPQVYLDSGRGFSEQESFFEEELPFTAVIPAGVRTIRIDPCSEFCIVSIGGIFWNGERMKLSGLGFKTNGKRIGADTYAFATSDPGFTLSLRNHTDRTENELRVEMTVTVLDAETAGRIGR